MTQAFEIYGPRGLFYIWKRRQLRNTGKGWLDIQYVAPLVRVWHVDPETDGSDDSCGFSWPKTTKEERERINKMADSEWTFMFGEHAQLKRASAYEITYTVWQMISWRFYQKWELSLREINVISNSASNPTDNLQFVIAEAKYDKDANHRLFLAVFNNRKRLFRGWYQHPRWHVHHWKIQIPFTLALKRFLFSRCAGCGKGFKWGYSPTSSNWNSKGPQWFKSEPGVFHSECPKVMHKKAA